MHTIGVNLLAYSLDAQFSARLCGFMLYVIRNIWCKICIQKSLKREFDAWRRSAPMSTYAMRKLHIRWWQIRRVSYDVAVLVDTCPYLEQFKPTPVHRQKGCSIYRALVNGVWPTLYPWRLVIGTTWQTRKSADSAIMLMMLLVVDHCCGLIASVWLYVFRMSWKRAVQVVSHSKSG